MDIPEIPDDKLAEEYDDLAYKALANPDISEGLANQIARVGRNTAANLRGGKREGAGRKPNAKKDLPVRSVLSVRIAPEYLAYAEKEVTTGRFRSVGEYVESLINGDMIHRQLP